MEREYKNNQEGQKTDKIGNDFIAKFRRSSHNRESYDEIAELEAELRKAYVAKELRAQLMERETERFIENVRKQHAAKQMGLEQQIALESDLCQRYKVLKEIEDYRMQLAEQITTKKEERDTIQANERKEREILMEVDRIREMRERFKTQEMKNELAEDTRRQHLIVQEIKIIQRQEQVEAEAKKFEEDEKYLAEVEQRAQDIKKLREEQVQKKERALCEIVKMLIDTETRKQERQGLIVELIAEDIKYELVIREEEQAIRRQKMKEELAADLEAQMVFTEECKLRFVEQDRAFAEEIMKKIMEDEKTARLTAEARRRMQVQYREDLVRLIEKRNEIREKEIARMEEAVKEERKREIIRIKHIREQRKLLLEQHASNVGDFLDNGTFSAEEREIITQFLKSERDVDSKT